MINFSVGVWFSYLLLVQGNTVLQFSTLVIALLRAAGLDFPEPVFDGIW